MAYTITPILHNIRSAHNVGSILRTCDGLGITEVWVSGYTPYPEAVNDSRLPHIKMNVAQRIAKTSLGAEKTVKIRSFETISAALEQANKLKLQTLALELTESSQDIREFQLSGDAVLVLGNEVEGLDDSIIKLVDETLGIPMNGKKKSFNVSVAGAIAFYTLLN